MVCVVTPTFAERSGSAIGAFGFGNNAEKHREQTIDSISMFSDELVEGHANPTTPPGTTQRNNETPILRRISDERVRAVIDSLVTNHSIARTRLTPIGVDGDRTVASWDDGEENWKNRRVEFLLQR